MTHAILVHGMYANELSWFDVPAALEAKGHTVDPVRLPGHTAGAEGLADIESGSSDVTMDDYLSKIEVAIPTKGKCTLIGHSFGGMVISHVAAKFHERINRLVYVAAMLPTDGESAEDIMGRSGSGAEAIHNTFKKHAPTEKRIFEALSGQPDKPLKAKFKRNDGFDGLPIHYIRCDNDKILPTKIQDEMIAAGTPDKVFNLSSDHLPQLSAKKKLNEALMEILH